MNKSSYGTTVKTGMAMKSATAGARHGSSTPNGAGQSKSKPKSHMGKGAAGATSPIKGADRGGVK